MKTEKEDDRMKYEEPIMEIIDIDREALTLLGSDENDGTSGNSGTQF